MENEITGSSLELSGKLLIAMPGMSDPRFEKSVVFLCAHSEDGAMGLIVNKPAKDVKFADLLEQLSIDKTEDGGDPRIHFGGPVEHARGFVLHSGDYEGSVSTLRIDDRFAMTATLDVLEDIARGTGPQASILALGYSGWGPGQLESEIAANGWLIGDSDADLVFDTNNGGKWGAALDHMGIDPLLLSATAGRA